MVIRSTGKNNHDSWAMSYIQEIFMRDSGDVNDDLNFEFGDGTVAHNGCGATLFGEFWYFGGGTGSTSANSQKRKMSKVVGCKLEQQSLELNFNFYKGSCQTFRQIFSNLNCFLIG